MIVSAWVLLAASVPVLMLDEFLIRRLRGLARFDLPVPVALTITLFLNLLK